RARSWPRAARAPCPARPPGRAACRSRTRQCRRPPAAPGPDGSLPATSRGWCSPGPATASSTGVPGARAWASAAPVTGALDQGLDHERQGCEQGEERGDGERADEVIFVVEDLDVRSEEHTSELQ